MNYLVRYYEEVVKVNEIEWSQVIRLEKGLALNHVVHDYSLQFNCHVLCL